MKINRLKTTKYSLEVSTTEILGALAADGVTITSSKVIFAVQDLLNDAFRLGMVAGKEKAAEEEFKLGSGDDI